MQQILFINKREQNANTRYNLASDYYAKRGSQTQKVTWHRVPLTGNTHER